MTTCVAVGDGIGCFGRGVGGNREEGEVRHFGVVTSQMCRLRVFCGGLVGLVKVGGIWFLPGFIFFYSSMSWAGERDVFANDYVQKLIPGRVSKMRLIFARD